MDNQLRETLIVILQGLKAIAGNTPGVGRPPWEALGEKIHELEVQSAVANARQDDDQAATDTPQPG